jgi:hypothetical protein
MQSKSIPAHESSRASFEIQRIDLDSIPVSQLLTPEQAAEILHVGPATLSVWRCTGRYALPYLKMGHKVFYRAGDLRAFIARRTRNHTGEVA